MTESLMTLTLEQLVDFAISFNPIRKSLTDNRRTGQLVSLYLSLALALLAGGCAMIDMVKTLDGTEKNVNAEFSFKSNYTEVLGSKMHYVDVGTGPTFLLLHGNPTSVYLWRNIIPHLQKHGRVIAVDLIGMGKSGKPDIEYRFEDHKRYLTAFIEKLGLSDITLVLHDWGSGLGFDYASHHEDNVRGIAFFESMTRPMRWADLGFLEEDMFHRMRDKRDGHKMIVIDNFFVDSAMQLLSGRDLTDEELAHYREPFRKQADRKPVRVFPLEVPFDGYPSDTHRVMEHYASWLDSTDIPKLLLWAKPGAIITPAEAKRIKARMKNLSTVYIGEGRHYLQEDQPTKIGESIARWFVEKVPPRNPLPVPHSL